ncbi:MAG: HEPN domain-containing protein [Deltaproteobacteria bacterium]|nr:HEPN domain-containing protein [Deltaproteobacteria bacterium]
MLLNLCGRGSPSILKELSFCTWLTPFGVEYRYPTEYPEVDQQTAQKAVEDAKKVKDAVMKELEGYLSKDSP